MTTPESRSRILGATGVVVVRRRVEESSDGQVATTTEEIVCIRNGSYHRRVRVAWVNDFMTGTEQSTILSDDLISAREYRDACADQPSTSFQQELRDELNQLRPACSACEAGMELKKGPAGEFWGCPFFPKCRGKPIRLSRVFQAKLEKARMLGVLFF